MLQVDDKVYLKRDILRGLDTVIQNYQLGKNGQGKMARR